MGREGTADGAKTLPSRGMDPHAGWCLLETPSSLEGAWLHRLNPASSVHPTSPTSCSLHCLPSAGRAPGGSTRPGHKSGFVPW